MLTLGVDLAAADERTATAALEWSGQGAAVRALSGCGVAPVGTDASGIQDPGRRAGHGHLVDELIAAAPWLDLGPFESLCRTSHDAFDAVIAALAARAAALGHVLLPNADQQEAARTEGWIALPTCGISDLASRNDGATR